MAKLIELCGCPGVGKTTIYKAVCKKHKSSLSFMPSEKVFRNKVNFTSSQKLVDFLLKTVAGNNTNLKDLKLAGDRFIRTYPAYIEACWHNIFFKQGILENGVDLRFEKAAYMYHTIQRVQYINELQNEKKILHDEGLVHRIGRALYKNTNIVEEFDEISQIIDHMPLPYAVIHIETDADENVKRLLNRKKIISMHKGKGEDDLRKLVCETQTRLNNTCLLLQQRNIPILKINSKLNIDVCVSQVITFLEQLN